MFYCTSWFFGSRTCVRLFPHFLKRLLSNLQREYGHNDQKSRRHSFLTLWDYYTHDLVLSVSLSEWSSHSISVLLTVMIFREICCATCQNKKRNYETHSWLVYSVRFGFVSNFSSLVPTTKFQDIFISTFWLQNLNLVYYQI